jgi:hypothetical protein
MCSLHLHLETLTALTAAPTVAAMRAVVIALLVDARRVTDRRLATISAALDC